jgi:hypothetical protein
VLSTKRVGGSPVTFFTVRKKKCSENRVPDVVINEGYSMYVFLREADKHVFYGDLITTTQ